MRFEKALKLSSYLLLSSGFAALVASQAVGPILATLYGGAIWASWSYRFSLSGVRQFLIFLLLTLVFLGDLVLLSGLVASSVHLLLMVSVVKAFTAGSSRDYLLLYSVSFTFVVIASTYTISIVFLIGLLLYVFFAILTFILFESRAAYRENPAAYFSLGGYVQVALAIAALVIVVSIPIFLAVPRNAFGLFRVRDNLVGQLSGFSDRVSLGDIGRIMTNRSVFMRIRVDRPVEELPAELKWRGVVLDHYDGKAWSNTRRDYQFILKDSLGRLVVPANRGGRESELRQLVTASPSTNVVFGANRIIQVGGNAVNRLRRDQNGTLTFPWRRVHDSIRYAVDSSLMTRAEQITRATDEAPPLPLAEIFLQLPPLDSRIALQARRLTSGHPSALAKALAIETFLRETYGYSLDNRSASAPDPLSDFLFRTREGHCEYFATALAVMLRTLGIPSRIVNGFQRGELNEWSQYFIVRQSDAHSWVEAFIPGAGWLEFDATPSAPLSGSYYLTQLAGQFLDAVDVFWTEIVTFDHLKQIGFFVSLANRLRHGLDQASSFVFQIDDWVRSFWANLKNWRGPTLVEWLALAAAIALLGLTYRYQSYLAVLLRSRVLGNRSASPAPDYLLEMLELLRRRGFARRPSETAVEFVERVVSQLGSPLPSRITELYYRSRFGNYPLARQEVAEIRTCLRQLRSRKVYAKTA